MKPIVIPALLLIAVPLLAADGPKVPVKNDAPPPCPSGRVGLPCTTGIYQYDGAGNIIAIGDDTFSYDGAGRLTSANLVDEGNKSQSYTYDAYGNMLAMTTNGNRSPIDTEPATNHLSNVPYDAAGNVRSLSGVNYVYDAANTVQSAQGDIDARYLYDADDERVGTITPQYNGNSSPAQMSATKYYAVWRIRDLGQRVIREFTEDATGGTPRWSWTHDYLYRGSLLLAEVQPDATTGGEKMWHYHLDHLGTPRLVTNDAGGEVSAHNFYPFGDEITDHARETFQFTGHERDDGAAGTQYYMHARYESVGEGRFLSVDPQLNLDAALAEPQMWNRYAYVRNNPVRLVDVDGRADNEVQLLWNRFKHIVDNHIDKVNRPDKSKFASDSHDEVKGLIKDTVKKENLVKTQGAKNVYEKNFGEPVGTRGETTVKVVTRTVESDTETVVTAHPTASGSVGAVLGVVSFVAPALEIYNFSKQFEKEYGRQPTFGETMRFMVTGDKRSSEQIFFDNIKSPI